MILAGPRSEPAPDRRAVGVVGCPEPDDIGARNPPRLPRNRRADRRRRDGGGLSGEGHEARPRRGPEGASGGDGLEPGAARKVSARGKGRRRAQSSAHRHDPLGRGIRRRPLPDHGARRRPVARPSDCRGTAAGREAGRDRHRARRRPGDGAREGHRSPGPEARQRHGGQRRAGQGARLRSRQSRIRRRRGDQQHGTADRDEDPGRRRDGDRAVHVAGAGPGPGSGPPDGHLLARHHPVRDGHRAAAVPGPLFGGARLVDPAGHAAAARRAAGRLAPKPWRG